VLQRHVNFSRDATGTFDEPTATLLLNNYMDDGYKDDGTIPEGVMYKVNTSLIY
jgi:hypothetical protein